MSKDDSGKMDVLEELKALLDRAMVIEAVIEQSFETSEGVISHLEEENAGMKAELEKVEEWKVQMNELLKPM